MKFTDLDLTDDVLDALYDMRFDECTPIQEKCIPEILAGRDLIGIAQTGTGKTAAYLLPILSLLAREEHPKDAVNCLIMAPTRELARQIDQVLQGLGYYTGIYGVAVYGGNDGERYELERRSLTGGADIVIATPGRLITHLQLGTLDLSRTTHLILDEADRMLDMGFADDILYIVKNLPKERQTILFSATMPEKIASLARNVMHNPVEVKIAVSKPAEKICQEACFCSDSAKQKVLQHLFSLEKPERVIVFASSKQKVKDLHVSLLRSGLQVAAMHSDLDQKKRDEVMVDFKARRIDVLVATDIVARGIDIDDIRMVVNYDVPRDAEDYVHRIGRTARAGRDGKAVTFVNAKDRMAFAAIERLLEKKVPRMELPEELRELADEAPAKGGERGGRRRGNADRKRSGKRNDGKRRGTSTTEMKSEKTVEAAKSEGGATQLKETEKKGERRRNWRRKKRPSEKKETPKS